MSSIIIFNNIFISIIRKYFCLSILLDFFLNNIIYKSIKNYEINIENMKNNEYMKTHAEYLELSKMVAEHNRQLNL